MTTPYYSDDFVTLYHGDCLEQADLWTLIVAATLAVILLVGAAATPDWRLW